MRITDSDGQTVVFGLSVRAFDYTVLILFGHTM